MVIMERRLSMPETLGRYMAIAFRGEDTAKLHLDVLYKTDKQAQEEV